MHGYGEITELSSNQTYHGFFANGRKDGMGIEKFENTGISFYGNWQNGKRHGVGGIFKNKRMLFLGTFEDDEKTGFAYCSLGLERYYDGVLFKG